MSEIQSHKLALEEKICELEEKLAGLKAELKKEDEAEQHKAIDQLDLHYGDLDSTFSTLKEFMDVLREDFRKTFG